MDDNDHISEKNKIQKTRFYSINVNWKYIK
jgi:hypothetical protein